MKKQIPAFLSGMLTAALIGVLSVSALAASGQMTITVDPINIQVNGQTFQPKDVNGNDVPVFALNGTTYAPLRALAEAYGLEVGYNKELNMATVTTPGGAATPSDDVASTPSDDGNVPGEDEAEYEFRNQDGEVVKYVEDPNSIYINDVKFISNTDGIPATALIDGYIVVNYELFMEIFGEDIPFDSQVRDFISSRETFEKYYTLNEFHYMPSRAIWTFLKDEMGYEIVLGYDEARGYTYFQY